MAPHHKSPAAGKFPRAFEFPRQLSENPNNVVVGLVRDKATTDKKKTVDVVASILKGSLNHLIANAAYISKSSQYDPIGVLHVEAKKDSKELEADLLETFQTNMIGNVHLFTLYTPLILKGRAKKVITISSGLGDMDLAREYKLALSTPYSISKTAMNATAEQLKPILEQAAAFKQYSPRCNGPVAPAESAGKIILQVNKASLETGYGGEFISHLGKGEKWL
ncbi:NAD(P)-binding protein [Xylaria acuta]|nr:NAD(P)-binding protein [Xylaria acuta]